MTFEADIGALNEQFFFREFTYSKNTFRPGPVGEVELADNIVWLDDQAIVFQLKERAVTGPTTAKAEEQWFRKKVVGLGTRQIRDTLLYLGSHREIELENHRGHRFKLSGCALTTTQKVVCYLPDGMLPARCRMQKFHRSASAGLIHLFDARDYAGVVQALITPPELAEYLAFREELFSKWTDLINWVPEQALVGQYILGDADSEPHIVFAQHLVRLQQDAEAWDMSGIIRRFPDRVTTDNEPTDYYSIIAQIAKLKRNELREFKLRFQMAMDKSHANEVTKPFRMASARTGCGFVFVPLTTEFAICRREGLKNLTHACKYDLRLEKCLGVSFLPEKDGWFSVEWCYMEFPWERDEQLEERLRLNNPFRSARTVELNRYT